MGGHVVSQDSVAWRSEVALHTPAHPAQPPHACPPHRQPWPLLSAVHRPAQTAQPRGRLCSPHARYAPTCWACVQSTRAACLAYRRRDGCAHWPARGWLATGVLVGGAFGPLMQSAADDRAGTHHQGCHAAPPTRHLTSNKAFFALLLPGSYGQPPSVYVGADDAHKAHRP